MTVDEAYELLGLSPTTNAAAIKRAWREQVRRWHPDHHPTDPTAPLRIQRINSAYDLLQRLPASPVAFDNVQRHTVHPYDAPAHDWWARGDDPYRGAPRRARPSAGEDIETSVTLDVVEALRGTDVMVDVDRWEACERCGGLDPETVARCERCHGFGREMVHESLTCAMPSGVADGDTVRISAVGSAGLWGGPTGDVVLHVRVEGYAIWADDDGRLMLRDIPLSLSEALLGATIRVPTPQGWKTLRLAGPVDVDRLYRVRSAGLPSGEGVGDLWCSFRVELPTLDEPAIQMVEQLDAMLAQAPRHRLSAEWSGVMDQLIPE